MRLAFGLLIALCLLGVSMPRRASASFGPIEGPYADYGGELADGVSNGVGLLPALVVAFGCAVVVLPADLYVMARNDAEFGAVTKDACMYPAGGTFLGLYIVSGAPFFALEKVFWDWPRDLLTGEEAPPDDVPAHPRNRTAK